MIYELINDLTMLASATLLSTIEVLERAVLNKRPPRALGGPRDNWQEIAQQVEADLFVEDLQHPQEDRWAS